jgi:hypothetical protein
MSKPPSSRLPYFFVAVGVVGPIALVASVWWLVRGEPLGPVFAIASLFFHQGDEAGVAELRGIGCENVFVWDGDETLDLPTVACTDFAGRVPTCEEVARTYGPFLPDPQEALVRVTSRGGAGVCDGRYAASGAYLGSTLDYQLGRNVESREP